MPKYHNHVVIFPFFKRYFLEDHGETNYNYYGTDYADDSELEDDSGPEDAELTEITTAGAAPE